MKQKIIRVGIVDDHQLFVNSLSLMINSFQGFQVVVETISGKRMLESLHSVDGNIDLVLLDVKMPEMSGAVLAKEIVGLYPLIKMIALSMNDDDHSILQMINNGACAYLLKEIHPTELEKALRNVYENGHYYSDLTNINFRRLLVTDKQNSQISIREKKFLDLAKTDLTYKQIALEMNLSERTIDGYRESLFDKFNVQSRVGMVITAIRRKIIEL